MEIPAFNEWRVETGKNSTLSLQLESGTAEIFGTELSPNVTYSFKEAMKIAIASYHGCKVSYTTTAPLESEYVSEETILKQLFNLHMATENLSMDGAPPRILLVGSKDSGKTTITRTLASYALKTSDKQPFVVNLNPQVPHFAISSQLTATKLYDILDVETFTLGETVTTGPGTGLYRSQVPIVKNFGLENFSENLELYKCLISELSIEVDSKLSASPSDSGTVIIDTPPLNVSDWKLIQHIIDSFQVDLVLVVGNERLLVDLRKKLRLSDQTSMIKMPRSSGCVDKEPKYERDLQQRSIRQYFYGVERSLLNPCPFHCSVKDFIFLRPIESDNINSEFLDFMSGDAQDADDDDNTMSYVKAEAENDDDYNPSSHSSSKPGKRIIKRNWKYENMFSRITDPKEADLMNVVVAIIDDKGLDFAKILSDKLSEKEKMLELNKHVTMKSVLGFTYISGCEDSSGKLKLLVPSPVKSMPGRILVITQMRYHE